jgi:transcriptional regulator with GAF, ATPase, and Fis domain
MASITPAIALEPWRELSPFEQFAMSLSSLSCTFEGDETADRLTGALEAIGTAFGAEECTLVTYGAHGEASLAGSWATRPHPSCTAEDLVAMPWLLRRVVRGIVVSVTGERDLPESAAPDRAHALRTGVTVRLAVPVVLGASVCYAMILGARRSHPEWNDAAAGRLRLVGEMLARTIDRLVHDQPARAAAARRPENAHAAHVTGDGGIIGQSPAIKIALERLDQVALHDVTVLLCGETGTGKELFARAVHERSRRREGPFIRVNCAALPPTLIESELFGHERGAFTDATSLRQGRFELAHGGTLLLDEIGDLAPELQSKMLRALQEGEFERVGSSKVRRVDVRVVAATHVDLEQAVAEGRFRADLFYRLNVFPIVLPPLRERRNDVPELVWSFIKDHQHEFGRHITTVPVDIMNALTRYDWPGNIRELENVIERALIRTTGETLQLDYPLQPSGSTPQSTGQTLDAVQRQYIEKVLRECGGRINGAGNAAVRLGLHPNTLRFRMKKLGVVVPGRADMPRPPAVSAADPP